MRCHDVDEAVLAEHLLGGLPPERERELESHLSGCGRCASERDRMRGLLAKVRQLGVPRAAPDRPERVGEILAALDRAPARPRAARANGTARRSGPAWAWAAAAGLLAAVTVFALAHRPTPRRAPAPTAKAEPGEPEGARSAAEPAPPPPERPAPVERKPDPPAAPEPGGPKPPSLPAPPKPAPSPAAPEPKPAETPVAPEKPVFANETVAAAVALEQVQGEVFRLGPDGPARVQEGDGLLPGQGVETKGAPSRARLRYPDGTRLELGPGTVVREFHDLEFQGARGKRVAVSQGTLLADVVKQPPGRSMVLTTPHAESTVLGTTFRLVVDAASTRLEVKEGRVRFARASAKSGVEVKTGQYAVAAAAGEPAARSLSLAEILLLPQHGHVAGKVWQLVRDPEAAAEQAFEALQTPSRGEQMAQGLSRAPRVSFSFQADPEITYYVWMRGRANPGSPPQDAVFVEVPGGVFTGQPPMDKDRLGGSPERALFEGFGRRPGYAWIGGDEQDGRHELPVRLRFTRPGVQTLTLHADETPIRIDAIWISATQSARPEDGQKGLWFHKK
jgi:ferric-dicitrate binding protein FerR (iron transport regulator)